MWNSASRKRRPLPKLRQPHTLCPFHLRDIPIRYNGFLIPWRFIAVPLQSLRSTSNRATSTTSSYPWSRTFSGQNRYNGRPRTARHRGRKPFLLPHALSFHPTTASRYSNDTSGASHQYSFTTYATASYTYPCDAAGSVYSDHPGNTSAR